MATNTLAREVFRETVSLSPCRSITTVYDMPPSYPTPVGLGIAVGVVAMASNECKGFGGTKNCTDFSRFGLVTNEKKRSPVKKFQCMSKKNNDQESSGPNLLAIIVGSSFCIAIAIFSFGFPKNLGLCHTTDVPYSCLVDGIRDESVTHVQFVENSRLIYYNTRPVDEIAETSKMVLGRIALMNAFASKRRYQTRNVGDDVSQLIKMLKNHGITYGLDPEPNVEADPLMKLSLISGFILMLLQCYQISSELNLGRMTKRKKRKEQPVTFAEVEGVDAAKAEIIKIVSCISKSKDRKDRKLVSKVPKGVLLTGPPGTGKTLLARALATEVGVSFHVASGTDFVEIFAGRGASRVRKLFEKARNSAPSIIFIDEIDAVGRQRGISFNSEADHTLNQLLIEMDGFYKDDNVVVLAATNIPEKLDPALLRRFTTKVVVGVPDQEGRRKIFGLYMRNVPMQGNKENICDYVASRTEGLVGSDLKEIAEESERLADHREGEFVTLDDVRHALDKAEQNNQFVRKTKTKNFLKFFRWP
ncbi:ATPase [Tanacetum coccineum]|uniref:ATPase n=1 Tax=Tanacetum coccineum TaxID=301880 RepID=A0ABQ5ILR8_9ASTR